MSASEDSTSFISFSRTFRLALDSIDPQVHPGEQHRTSPPTADFDPTAYDDQDQFGLLWCFFEGVVLKFFIPIQFIFQDPVDHVVVNPVETAYERPAESRTNTQYGEDDFIVSAGRGENDISDNEQWLIDMIE